MTASVDGSCRMPVMDWEVLGLLGSQGRWSNTAGSQLSEDEMLNPDQYQASTSGLRMWDLEVVMHECQMAGKVYSVSSAPDWLVPSA